MALLALRFKLHAVSYPLEKESKTLVWEIKSVLIKQKYSIK